MQVLDQNLEDTVLFQRMENASNEIHQSQLAGNVKDICKEAANHLRKFYSFHKEFTVHDELHSCRVVILMGLVLGEQVKQLNAAECSLLILSAYLHDIGMVPSDSDLSKIKNSSDWILFEKTWIQEHPNYTEVQALSYDTNLSDERRGHVQDRMAELREAMFTEYIRRIHGERSAEYVVAQYRDDPRLKISNRSIADVLARLCKSHVMPSEYIDDENGLRLNENIGNLTANSQQLAYVLRLADILDFDRDRTPDSLFRSISFTSPISLKEW